MKEILVARSSMPSLEEYVEEIKPLWESHWLTNMGVYHQKLEQQLMDFLNVSQVSLFSNGHMALELVLQALNLSGEVITTPYTFVSTTHAIVRNNLTPVFCDIDPDTCTLDTSKLEDLITDKTSAILPVHVYGAVCNVKEIDRIAKKYGLKVVYDAAHTFGVKVNGKGIANFGDASIFSFHATKVFQTIEGGAVCFNEEELGKVLYRLKNFGIRSEEVVDGIGANAKMNEFQAAMGICNLRHINSEIDKRRKVVERYRKNLKDIDGLRLFKEQQGVDSNYAYFPVFFYERNFGATRNEVYNLLKENGIYARKYFYPLTSTLDCYKGKFSNVDTPIALEVSKRVLTLPLYADLDLESVDRICEIILRLKK